MIHEQRSLKTGELVTVIVREVVDNKLVAVCLLNDILIFNIYFF